MCSSLLNWLNQTWSGFTDLVFPPSCTSCDEELTERIDMKQFQANSQTEADELSQEPNLIRAGSVYLNLCRTCFSAFSPDYQQLCLRCGAGRTLPGNPPLLTVELSHCTNCPETELAFKSCVAIGNYQADLRRAVLQVKAGTHDGLVEDLAKLLAAKIRGRISADCVMAIPTHWRTRLRRKINVPSMLAEAIGKQLRLPLIQRALGCRRVTRKQGKLTTRERLMNVRDAFAVTRPRSIRGRQVLLVDDVMTSGATLNEAAATCLKAGAHSVVVAVIARGTGQSLNRKKPKAK